MVTVKGYVDRVVIVASGQVVATHARSPQLDTLILDPLHYLATLGRKLNTGPCSGVPRPEAPCLLRRVPNRLEQHHGAMAGARRFARILQLLADHPLTRVRQAVEACRREATDQR